MIPPNGTSSPAFSVARPSAQFERDLVALIPHLQAFSRRLCGSKAIAEDMAQEALAKALRSHDHFEAGTNQQAWLFTILRNEFYSHTRRAWREAHWEADRGESIPAPAHEQEWTMELSDTARALGELPEIQRDALILVAAGGFSYEDAADISGTPTGTAKSRVARARTALSKLLEGGKPLPPRPPERMANASHDILAQLSALMRPCADIDGATAGKSKNQRNICAQSTAPLAEPSASRVSALAGVLEIRSNQPAREYSRARS